MSHVTVYAAIKAAQEGGLRALAPKPTGRQVGQKRQLTPEQELRIQRLICEKRPEQLKMQFALWTRAAVMQLVKDEFGIELPVRTMGEYLKRWGFTPKRPVVRAYEQRPESVKQWLEHEYPAIEARAKQEDAEIHWGDETAVVNTDVRGRGYHPKGHTPVAMAVGGTRHKLSMISTVTNQGKTRWMVVEDAFNSDKLIEFLQALVKDSPKKVYLILDNLPSYSPELNPDERLNAGLKQALGSRVQVLTKDKLKSATPDHMKMLETRPDLIKAYFQDPHVKYAA